MTNTPRQWLCQYLTVLYQQDCSQQLRDATIPHHTWALCLVWSPKVKRDTEKPGRPQQSWRGKCTEVVMGWEILAHEERLKGLGSFSLEKRRLSRISSQSFSAGNMQNLAWQCPTSPNLRPCFQHALGQLLFLAPARLGFPPVFVSLRTASCWRVKEAASSQDCLLPLLYLSSYRDTAPR